LVAKGPITSFDPAFVGGNVAKGGEFVCPQTIDNNEMLTAVVFMRKCDLWK
jgi:hypothetical protein